MREGSIEKVKGRPTVVYVHAVNDKFLFYQFFPLMSFVSCYNTNTNSFNNRPNQTNHAFSQIEGKMIIVGC